MQNRTDELGPELEAPLDGSVFVSPETNNVRTITREDRERAAFRRLTLAVAALIQRAELEP